MVTLFEFCLMHAEYFTHQTLDMVAHHSTAQLLAYRQTDFYIFALIRENIKTDIASTTVRPFT